MGREEWVERGCDLSADRSHPSRVLPSADSSGVPKGILHCSSQSTNYTRKEKKGRETIEYMSIRLVQLLTSTGKILLGPERMLASKGIVIDCDEIRQLDSQ